MLRAALGLPRRLARPGRDVGEAGREEEGLSGGGGIQRSEEEENVRREEALAVRIEAGSDRKVVEDCLATTRQGSGGESWLRAAGQWVAFGVNFGVGTPLRCISGPRKSSQIYVTVSPLLPSSFSSN